MGKRGFQNASLKAGEYPDNLSPLLMFFIW
jgi:hypothetical protein